MDRLKPLLYGLTLAALIMLMVAAGYGIFYYRGQSIASKAFSPVINVPSEDCELSAGSASRDLSATVTVADIETLRGKIRSIFDKHGGEITSDSMDYNQGGYDLFENEVPDLPMPTADKSYIVRTASILGTIPITASEAFLEEVQKTVAKPDRFDSFYTYTQDQRALSDYCRMSQSRLLGYAAQEQVYLNILRNNSESEDISTIGSSLDSVRQSAEYEKQSLLDARSRVNKLSVNIYIQEK